MSKVTRIIIVGPDGCGKTEIAKEFYRRTCVPYYKARGEKTNFRTGGNQFLNELLYAEPRQLDWIEQLDLSFVMDRGYPCEFVYASVFNRETNIDAIMWADKQYARLDTRIILCTRSVYKKYDDDDYAGGADPETLQRLDTAYRGFLKVTNCQHLILNVDDENLSREITDIYRFLDRCDQYKCKPL